MFKKTLNLVALSLASLMFLTATPSSASAIGSIFSAIFKAFAKEAAPQVAEQAVKQTGKESGGLTAKEIVGKEIAKAGVKIGARRLDYSTGTATYSGEMEFNIDSDRTNVIPNISYIGDLSMEVNFDDMTFEGTAVLTRYDSSLKEFVSIGTVNLDSTPIGDNGFEGTFTLDEAVRADIGLTGNPVGNYAGNFVDLDKDEITGVVNISGISADGAVLGIGSFSRNWQFENGEDKGFTLETKIRFDSIVNGDK
ncbi:MAG: hypothetical protein K8953_13680 [Proteobacteria bacterium]|nr:hypothetical protein [Pseudomonadota bacterium]